MEDKHFSHLSSERWQPTLLTLYSPGLPAERKEAHVRAVNGEVASSTRRKKPLQEKDSSESGRQQRGSV